MHLLGMSASILYIFTAASRDSHQLKALMRQDMGTEFTQVPNP
jgi:predicted component of type VI protein secretion system